MKKTLLVFSIAIIVLIVGTSSVKRISYSTGSRVKSYAGSCTGCHGRALTGGSVTLLGIPSTIQAGKSYPCSLKISNNTTNAFCWGMALKASTGTFTSTNPEINVQSATVVTHSNGGATVATGTSYTYNNLTWKAPTTATVNTTVTFSFSGNAANNDGNDGNSDHLYNGTYTTTVTLPVVLTSFFVSAKESSKALISWQTSNEVNSNHFEIEKSIDQKTFTVIGKVDASGNSTVAKSYLFTDVNAHNSAWYRLKMVDNDGSFTYSEIKVLNTSINATAIESVYPNPIKAGQHVTVKLQSDKAQTATFVLFNNAGKTLMTAEKQLTKGSNAVELNLGRFILPGLYHVAVRAGETNLPQTTIIVE